MNKTNDRPWDIIGSSEIAEEFGVCRNLPSLWAKRRNENNFPIPIALLKMGPVYDRLEILKWHDQYINNEGQSYSAKARKSRK